jgi:predicted ATPase
MVEMMALGDLEEGYRFGKLALKLMDVINCREMMARTYNAVYGFLSSYKEPIRDSIMPLTEAYRLNILTGDVEVSVL